MSCYPENRRISRKCHWFTFPAKYSDDEICVHDHRINIPLDFAFPQDDFSNTIDIFLNSHFKDDLRNHSVSPLAKVGFEIFCLGPQLGIPIVCVDSDFFENITSLFLKQVRTTFQIHRHGGKINNTQNEWIFVCLAYFFVLTFFRMK